MLQRESKFVLQGFVIVVAIVFAILVPNNARATPPDYSICQDLKGAAWGLCRAGVAVGCDTNTGNATACDRIEENYKIATGHDAPWLIPPVVCPCDWYMVSQTVPPYDASGSGGYNVLVCHEDINVIAFFDNPGDWSHKTELSLHGNASPDAVRTCNILSNDSGVNFHYTNYEGLYPFTPDQYLVCKQNLINYAREFHALNPDAPWGDICP